MMPGKVTLMSGEELLERWRVVRGWEPLPSAGGSAEDARLEQMMKDELRGWYCATISSLPPGDVPAIDLSGQTLCGVADPERGLEARLPAGCLRVTAVRLRGWERCALPEERELDFNPFCLPGPESPAAALGGAGTIRLLPATGALELLLGVPDPEESGTYCINGAVLDRMRDMSVH